MKQAARLRHWLSLLMHGETGGMVPSAEKTLQEILELFGGEAGGPHPPSAEHTLVEIRDLLTGGVGATAAEIWSHAARELDLALPASVVPSAVASATSAAAADVFGAWAQLDADVGTGKRLVWVAVRLVTPTAVVTEIELGEGAGGSESAVTRLLYVFTNNDATNVFMLWRELTDNARLSVRARDTDGAAVQYQVLPIVV